MRDADSVDAGATAYRRPATSDDVQTLLGFYQRARAEGTFDTGIRAALERLLVSPDFLFRIEADPDGVAPGTAYRLSDVELASRLSFFLWSSIPDDELLDLAIARTTAGCGCPRSAGATDARRSASACRAGGQLLRPVAADAQRLAADARCEHEVSLVRRQPAHRIRAGDGAVPRRSAESGPRHRGVADGGLDVSQRAARAPLRDFRRVRKPLPSRDARRREPLGAARQGERPRGHLVSDPHLADHPRQVAARKHPGCAGAAASSEYEYQSGREHDRQVRDRCARCSSSIAPTRCARRAMRAWTRSASASRTSMRSANGARRTARRRSTRPVCCSTAPSVDGPAALRRALLAQKEQFVRTVTGKLLTYAIGRQMEYSDAPAIRAIVRSGGGR